MIVQVKIQNIQSIQKFSIIFISSLSFDFRRTPYCDLNIVKNMNSILNLCSSSCYQIILNKSCMKLALLCLLLFLAISQAQYTVVDKQVTSSSIKLSLKYTGSNDYYVKPKSKVVKDLVFLFKALTYSEFTFKIYDPKVNRYQVPQGIPFPTDQQANFSFPLALASYKINYTSNHFSFLIVRKETQAVIFDSSVVQLQFSEYYLQFGTITDSKTVFGYSERFTKHFALKSGTWTVWNKDNGQLIDNGDQHTGGVQTYGYYPVFMIRERSGKHHVGYFRSSNALDLEIQTFSNTSSLEIYRVIGGIIDFRFILGDNNPETLLTNFHEFVGKAFIPPFWAFGFHQCRWGYTDIGKVQKVLQNYERNGLPLDTIWTDIDYMHENETFTVDAERFPLDRLRNITKRYRYIPIVEASARNRQSYAFEQGSKRNVFIQAAEGGNLVGKVWAGETVFVDNFHPNATQFWKDMLQYLYNQVQFSGVWLDMNEISNMCDGPCTPPQGQSIIDYSKDIPYQPGGKNVELSTIPLNSTHYGNRLEANVHAFFGLMESYNSFQFLKTKGRPFIVTRSNTLGSSRYAAHWTGDNFANFTFLRMSISSNFMLGMWGMQMVGSDICGFGGNATEQVCSRYFQLGSLYPFARDHNQFDSIDQEPYALGPVVLECSKKNLKLRYSLLKSYYREFIIRRGAGTIFRPVYFQFFQDINLLQDDVLQTQFLIGRSLLSTPIVEEGKIQRTAYFPGDIWYNLYNGQSQNPGSLGIVQNNLTDLVPLYIRNGFFIFRQNVDNVTKTEHLLSVFELVGGFKLKSTNSTHKTYQSEGGILSLGDYNNNDDVEKCINQGCDFKITATIQENLSTSARQLTLETLFDGRSVRYQQRINKFTLYVQGRGVINFSPKEAVVIYREGQQTLDING